jgi:hypothetical protein
LKPHLNTGSRGKFINFREMPTQIIDRAALVSTIFLIGEDENVSLDVRILPKDELFGVMIRLNGKKIFPKNGIYNNIPSQPILLGKKSFLKEKELIIDSYIIDDDLDTSDDTYIEIKLLGLSEPYERILHQKAVPNGSMVIYRIEIKFF